jgi:hypothetical protein
MVKNCSPCVQQNDGRSFHATASLEIQGETRVLPDMIGAAVLAGEVLVLSVLVRILIPTLGVPYWGWILFVAVIGALLSWHSENRPAQPKSLMRLVVGSVVLGVLFFAIDVLVGSIGSIHKPYHSLIDAAGHAGGPFGIITTLLVCPGITIFALASAARACYVTGKDSDT